MTDDVAATTTFNRSELLERVAGMEDLLEEMLRLFLEESGSMMAEVASAVAGGDPEQIRKSAHSLKGAFLTIAAGRGADLALELENLGREGRVEDAGDVMDRLNEECTRVAAAVQAALGS
jgi:HPt (histidine-containing phosphotransfer) domain-containing protein